MKRQDLFKSLRQRFSSRFIDASEPFLKLLNHALCILITVLFQGNLKPPVNFAPAFRNPNSAIEYANFFVDDTEEQYLKTQLVEG